jgi:hypothetical protein
VWEERACSPRHGARWVRPSASVSERPCPRTQRVPRRQVGLLATRGVLRISRPPTCAARRKFATSFTCTKTRVLPRMYTTRDADVACILHMCRAARMWFLMYNAPQRPPCGPRRRYIVSSEIVVEHIFGSAPARGLTMKRVRCYSLMPGKLLLVSTTHFSSSTRGDSFIVTPRRIIFRVNSFLTPRMKF